MGAGRLRRFAKSLNKTCLRCAFLFSSSRIAGEGDLPHIGRDTRPPLPARLLLAALARRAFAARQLASQPRRLMGAGRLRR